MTIQDRIDTLRREMAKEVFSAPRLSAGHVARQYARRISDLIAEYREPNRPNFARQVSYAGRVYILSQVTPDGVAKYASLDTLSSDINATIEYARDEEIIYLASYPIDTEFSHL